MTEKKRVDYVRTDARARRYACVAAAGASASMIPESTATPAAPALLPELSTEIGGVSGLADQMVIGARNSAQLIWEVVT